MVQVKEFEGNLKEEGLVSLSPSVSGSSCDNAVLNPTSLQGRMAGPIRRSTKGGSTEEEVSRGCCMVYLNTYECYL
ncbi:hypothetical protein ACE6H2_019519 [Prunus campanulata]